MKQDDPEKCFADLERQLAEQHQSADLPPVGAERAQPGSASNSDPAQRRFVVNAMPSTRKIYSTFGLLYAVSSTLVYPITGGFGEGFDGYTRYRALISLAWWVGLALVWWVGLALVWFLALRWLFWRRVVICVTTDGLTIDQRPGDVFSPRGRRVGPMEKYHPVGARPLRGPGALPDIWPAPLRSGRHEKSAHRQRNTNRRAAGESSTCRRVDEVRSLR